MATEREKHVCATFWSLWMLVSWCSYSSGWSHKSLMNGIESPFVSLDPLFLIYTVSLRLLFCPRAEHAASLELRRFCTDTSTSPIPFSCFRKSYYEKKDENLDKKANLLQFIFIVLKRRWTCGSTRKYNSDKKNIKF